MSIRGSDIFLKSRRLLPCTGLCRCPGKSWKFFDLANLSPLADLESLCKQKVKTKIYKLPARVLTSSPNRHTAPHKEKGGLVLRHLRNLFPNIRWPIRWPNRDIIGHTTKTQSLEIEPRKSLRKQTAATNTVEGRLISRIYTLHFLKYPV